ncbi:MAG: NAD-dependent epimerase/dehydratase family protein [Pseudorhodoferax sp.]
MRILIFGAAGFIGSHLTRSLARAGHEVVALCRADAIPGFDGACVPWRFGQEVPSDAIRGAQAAIHLAHDFHGEPGARTTLSDTLRIMQLLDVSGVQRQLFFSSYSAGAHATSIYGRTKYAIEQASAPLHSVVIVRPGLVVGPGGIYGRIENWVRRSPIIPLPDGGHGRVPVIRIDRLAHETLRLIEAPSAVREVNLFEPKLSSLRELVMAAAPEVQRRRWIVNIPSRVILVSLKLAAALRIPSPVNSDSLDGFLANQSARHTSSLRD